MKPFPQFKKLLIGGIISIFIIGAVLIYYQNQIIKTSLINDLEQSDNAVIAAVDPARFERLSAGSADLNSPDYLRLREQFQKFENIYKQEGIRGFYAMKINGNQIQFFVDSAAVNDPWHSEPGVVYQDPPSVLASIFIDGQGQFVGPYTDEYGTFYSFFTPVRNNSGNIVAVMGVDVESASFNKSMIKQLELLVLLMLLIISGYLSMLFLIKRRLEIISLSKEKGKLEEKVDIKTEELNSYVKDLEKKTTELETLNRLMVGREIKMMELKKENEYLKNKLGINL